VSAQLVPLETAADVEATIREVLSGVMDPEIPVLSLADLGVIRFVEAHGERVRIGITPTYSGCPATLAIRRSILAALSAHGFGPVEVIEVLSPPWSSADLSAAGRDKLEAFGIAPPQPGARSPRDLSGAPRRCPHCQGRELELLSEFGSTPCKALYRCRDCGEPFDYFKCL
jgi:ring-1,2-phenylacetyl-CoA epoxidase subunit PaaD